MGSTVSQVPLTLLSVANNHELLTGVSWTPYWNQQLSNVFLNLELRLRDEDSRFCFGREIQRMSDRILLYNKRNRKLLNEVKKNMYVRNHHPIFTISWIHNLHCSGVWKLQHSHDWVWELNLEGLWGLELLVCEYLHLPGCCSLAGIELDLFLGLPTEVFVLHSCSVYCTNA